jgi:chromosome segregation ATPase
MKLFNRKVKDLEQKIEDLDSEILRLTEANSALLWNASTHKITIEGLKAEIEELKQENVDLLDRLRKVLKEVVENETDSV